MSDALKIIATPDQDPIDVVRVQLRGAFGYSRFVMHAHAALRHAPDDPTRRDRVAAESGELRSWIVRVLDFMEPHLDELQAALDAHEADGDAKSIRLAARWAWLCSVGTRIQSELQSVASGHNEVAAFRRARTLLEENDKLLAASMAEADRLDAS